MTNFKIQGAERVAPSGASRGDNKSANGDIHLDHEMSLT
jgi:hypothetical protein